jgi:dihydrofolate synthase/folylpolyglutamate synthase
VSVPIPLPNDLAGWLKHIEALHPKSIAMGLDRINKVRHRLNLNPEFPVIIVGGTNGKGSTCAMLERIYHEAGYRVACYTSPHLLRYNERVRVACQEASDEALSAAFSAVEAARHGVDQQSISLTYFEFGTLAAMWHFMRTDVDVAILEVGLGGRLDAVNIFDPACAIVTSIDLDHMDFLGNSRESIGYEKAGIFRAGIPAICGDPNPPNSLVDHAAKIGADFKQIQHDFDFTSSGDHWLYRGIAVEIADLPVPALTGSFQLYNAVCVMAAIEVLQAQLPVTMEQVTAGLRAVRLPGRFQHCLSAPEVILDVAHNPHAAVALVQNLRQLPGRGRTLAVFAMLADKDIAGVIDVLHPEIDVWYLADIQHPRGATAQQLARLIHQAVPGCKVHMYTDVSEAYRQACFDAGENDRIIVFGSFFTVADVMRLTSDSLQ